MRHTTSRIAKHEQCVALHKAAAYNRVVIETAVTRGESRKSRRRTTAARRFFFVRTSLRAFYGRALVGVRSRTPVSFCAGLSTLPCVRPPPLEREGGAVHRAVTEGACAMPTKAPVRTGQNSKILSVVREALRAAAMADTYQAALDVAGDRHRRQP